MALRFAPHEGHAFSIPSFSLNSGELVELLLPVSWNPDDTQEVYTLVAKCCSDPAQLVIATSEVSSAAAQYPNKPLRELALDQPTLVEVCERAGVSLDDQYGMLPWTARSVLDVELGLALAPHPEVLVVDDMGLDPQGEKVFSKHLQDVLAQRDVAGVALRFAVVDYQGKPRTPSHPRPWAKRRIAVVVS